MTAGGGSRQGGRRGTTAPDAPRKRSLSSRQWLDRQQRDPYVARARQLHLRSRAAFKLQELDDRFRILKAGAAVVDLGAAPGGWSQVAAARVGPKGRVVAVDLVPLDPIAGVHVVTADLGEGETLERIRTLLKAPADVVLSDMAPATSGHAGTDHDRIMALAEIALDTALALLRPGGAFVCKVFQGGTETTLLAAIKTRFATVRHAKPPASRPESAEMYLVATGFRG